jgi:hypothetical protein
VQAAILDGQTPLPLSRASPSNRENRSTSEELHGTVTIRPELKISIQTVTQK